MTKKHDPTITFPKPPPAELGTAIYATVFTKHGAKTFDLRPKPKTKKTKKR